MNLLKLVRAKKLEGGHKRAEHRRVLCRSHPRPAAPPVYPCEAWRLLTENILPHFTVVVLSAAPYSAVLRQAAEKGWTGGFAYDVPHLAAATTNHC